MHPTNPQLCQTVGNFIRNEGIWLQNDWPYRALILTKLPRACSGVTCRCELSIHKPVNGLAEDHASTAKARTTHNTNDPWMGMANMYVGHSVTIGIQTSTSEKSHLCKNSRSDRDS